MLFVAEKRAALDVVHERLEKCGLGPLCLELHSHKANKKHVYANLKKTLELGEPKSVHQEHYERVRRLRDELNRISSLLHRMDAASGETPYGIIGEIAGLCEGDCPRPDFSIPGADSWDNDGFDARLEAAGNLAALTVRFGSERKHIWRGTQKRLNQVEQGRLAAQVAAAAARLAAMRALLDPAVRAAGTGDAGTVSATGAAAVQLEALDAMPEAVPGLLESAALAAQPDAALEICKNVAALQQLKSDLLRDVIESALELPWHEERLAIGQSGGSLFRWFNGRYRSAVGRLRSVHRAALPKGWQERLAVLDRLLEFRRMSRALDKDESFGRSALGRLWRGADTDAKALLPALRWVAAQARMLGSGHSVKQQVDGIPASADLAGMARELRSAHVEWSGAWQAVAGMLKLDCATAFNSDSVESVAWADLHERLESWESSTESMDGWHRLSAAARRASTLGLEELRRRLADGRLDAGHAQNTLRFVRALAVWDRMRREEPELEDVDGEERSAKVEEFKRLDRELQRLASQEIALRHFRSLPAGSAGQIGIVRGEANKKARHMPLRRLLDKAGEAVAAVKPVFLMSPLSVAQFLRPGGLTFDLALIDEASQVRPADGLGAVVRARQVVVVGDQKQLPPTSFFDRQVAGNDAEAEHDEAADIQAAQVGDMESILSLCEARSMAGGMLRWHYRSKHPSLIQVSNHEFYDNGLICPPSPDGAGGSSGLTLVKVEGTYDRGRKRNNPQEAAAVAWQVLAHAREHPHETLGVVTLSVAQRDTIRDKLEFMRSEFPELDAFCKESKSNPFFVKNLENVQGDERDVIFISVGYGKDANGYMSQSFGPVSSEGGERRLNVLFTRAKTRCRVFSTIGHDDIRLDATKQAGPRVLKRFLKFAETGELDIPLLPGAEMDSPFEEAVARALQSHGYRVAAQVGSSGFRIDLAVYDPDRASRFLLAIECDGARYHSSSWARERDRLRQIVLEQKGWKIHRIWSTDWFYRRDAEMQKLLEAIERARSGQAPGTGSARSTARAETVVERAATTPNREPKRRRYAEAVFEIPESMLMKLHEMPLERLERYVTKIVETEAPVHVEEVGRRLSRLWGYNRAGQRIQSLVRQAAERAVWRKLIRWSDDSSGRFLECCNGSQGVTARDRSDAASPSLRKVDMLPPSEIQSAVLEAVEKNIALNAADCAVETARAFGYKSTSADLRKRVEENVEKLVAKGCLERHGFEFRRGAPAPRNGLRRARSVARSRPL